MRIFKTVNTTKKIMALLLALVLILGLAGCGGNNTQTTTSSDDQKEASSEAQEGSNISFETEDLEGNPVKADSLFTNNKITMVNIWGTTCGPCIEELPELEEYSKKIAKKGGAIIGIVKDVPQGNNLYLQEAKDIVKDTGVTFLNLRAWDDLDTTFNSIGTPTTYFVDSNGNIIGDPILGANVKKYEETMDKLLSEAK